MKNSYFVIDIVLNLILAILFIATFDTKITVSYSQQLDTNVTTHFTRMIPTWLHT